MAIQNKKIIEIKSLTYKINEKKILQNVSLEISKGDMVSIIGPNGSGKSTLIRLLSGELKPSAGEVCFLSKSEQDWNSSKLALHRAVLSQSNVLSFPFSAYDIVRMGRHPHRYQEKKEESKRISKHVLESFNLSNYSERNYTTLSGGEKQRVQIARVITQIWSNDNDYRNKVLILDEPDSYLDINHQAELFSYLKKLNKKGLTIILVLHDINHAIQKSNKVIMLKNSKLIDYLESDQLATSNKINEVFDIKPTLLYNNELSKPIIFFKNKEDSDG